MGQRGPSHQQMTQFLGTCCIVCCIFVFLESKEVYKTFGGQVHGLLKFSAALCAVAQHGYEEAISDILDFYQELQVQICVSCDFICDVQRCEYHGNVKKIA